MNATYQTVLDFFDLYTSERRELAGWLSVERRAPTESDFDFGSRVLIKARELGKVDELAARIAEIKSAR